MISKQFFVNQLSILEQYASYRSKVETTLGVVFDDNEFISVEYKLIDNLCHEVCSCNPEMKEPISELIFLYCFDCEYGNKPERLTNCCIINDQTYSIVTGEDLYDICCIALAPEAKVELYL